MCGICGRFNAGTGRPVEAGVLSAMRDAMVRRGPDDAGLHVEGPLGLGFRRLSIVDLAGGNQPLASEDGRTVLVGNGEIYNHLELRRRLEGLGHVFATGSDMEAALHAFEQWGPDSLAMLRGMFALAVWDAEQQRLVLARDGLGIKPLYWTKVDGGVSFASEIKGLLADPDTDRSLSPGALASYFQLNYVPEPDTAYAAIRRLPAGHCLAVDEKGVREERFWDVTVDEDPAAADPGALLEVLEDAVRAQLMADVPVGLLLSGGIDSAAVAALYARCYGHNLLAYTACFDDPGFDELDGASLLARHLGLRHRHVRVTEAMAVADAPAILAHFDEPFGDSSALAVHFVAALAAEEVKVVLTGDGCDECLAGYETYVADGYARRFAALPAPVRALARGLAHAWPPSYSKVGLDEKLRRFTRYASASVVRSHARWRTIMDVEDMPGLLAPGFLAEARQADPFAAYEDTARAYGLAGSVNDCCLLDLKLYLPSDMLVKVDRMSMYHSLEARPPFLDQAFVRHAFRVPSGAKLRGRSTKDILRRALRGLAPEATLDGPKRGFNVPVGRWFRGALGELLLERLHGGSGVGDWLRVDGAQRLLETHRSGRSDQGMRLWGLLAFLVWLQDGAAQG